ncbi:MAG: LysR family transcriptional regulator [Variibacter sp.]
MRNPEFAALTAFVAVAEQQNFTRAAASLGIATSTLSQTIRTLEEQLGVRLLNRTTRSVAPTEAGARLLDRLQPALESIGKAVETVNAFRDSPMGTLRLSVSRPSILHVIAPLLKPFLAEHPAITVEIVAEDSRQDIISGRFDAGVRVGEFIEQDMLAVRLADEFRMIAVASPKYLEQHPVPLHPDDLRDHNCIRHRWSSDAAMHPWSFQRGNETIDVAVDGQLVVNDLHLALYAARDGAGVAYLPEAFVCPYFNAGLLVRLLDDWSHTRSGVFLYYSGRRHVPAPLQAFIGYVRRRGNAKKTSTETASRNGRASPYDETLARASIIGGTAMGGAPNGGARID